VLVVAGATEPLDSAAVARVRRWIDGGGATLVLLEPVTLTQQSPVPVPASSGLEPLIEERGISISPGLVMDMVSSQRVNVGRQGIFNVIAPYPLWPVVGPAGDHPVTNGLSALSLSWGAALQLDGDTTVTPLWRTSEGGAIQRPGSTIMPDQEWNVPDEELGVLTVAAASLPADSSAGGRMIVVGDASFTDPQFIQSSPGNLSFLANAIDWLSQEEALITILSKDRTPPQLVFAADSTRNVLKWGNQVGVPLLFVLLGVIRVTGRRARAEARWKEVVS
jgi:ABC-type uncharacterized transport system involved in gliding motility auxiliary subunit